MFSNRTQKQKSPETVEFQGFLFGGDKRDRTADLLNAIQALSQLSYTPILYIYLTKEGGVCQVSKSAISQKISV